jgi:hypothetical protein
LFENRQAQCLPIFFVIIGVASQNPPLVMKKPDHPQRYLQLLIAILVIFIVSPFVAPYYYGPTILSVIGAAMLLSATYAVSRRRSCFSVGLAMSLF